MNKIKQFRRVAHFPIKDLWCTRRLVNHLVTSSDDAIILPYIDHPGPLSDEILSKNFRSLTVCEPDPEIREKFKTFVSKHHPSKIVNIHPYDLFDLSHKTYSDTAQKQCAEIVQVGRDAKKYLADVDAKCDKNVKLLVPLLMSRHEVGTLRNLYYQVCLRLGFCSSSFVHYYFLMSDRQQAYMEAQPGHNMRLYRSSSVLYNTIFNMKTLESFDLKSCFGIQLRKIQKTAAANNASYRKVHLVLMEPKLDVITSLGPRSLIEFRFLVMQMMQKRKILVTTFLDRFFDNHMDDVTKIGIVKTTRAGDLSKEQYLRLFLYLSSRPDYKSSTFLQAVASTEDIVNSL